MPAKKPPDHGGDHEHDKCTLHSLDPFSRLLAWFWAMVGVKGGEVNSRGFNAPMQSSPFDKLGVRN